MSITAIVPAAGLGRRMKDNLPKQFHMLGNRPILFHTLSRLADCPKIDEIIVAVPEDHLEFARVQHEEEYKVSKPVRFVIGGLDRQESVRAGLLELSLECDLVIIHDGVRPFVTNDVLVAVINSAEKHGAATAAIRPPDAVKLVEPHHKPQNLPRESVFLIQTPQAFHIDLIRMAHQRAYEDNFKASDDSMLVERLGERVAIVDGHPFNIKITTPEDVILAKAITEQMEAKCG